MEFDPPCEGHPEEGSPMEIDTCHNFGILGIGVQKKTPKFTFLMKTEKSSFREIYLLLEEWSDFRAVFANWKSKN